jgi:hypothetical protein
MTFDRSLSRSLLPRGTVFVGADFTSQRAITGKILAPHDLSAEFSKKTARGPRSDQ